MLTSAFTKSGLAPGGVVLHPRSWIDLLTSVGGDDIATGIQPSKMSLHRGAHNRADEARVTLDSTAFSFPIREIAGSVGTLYFAAVEEASDPVRLTANRRFAGIVVDYDEDLDARTTVLEMQDLSYLCRRKTYPVRVTVVRDNDGNFVSKVDPTPRYADSLKTNIQRLLSILPEFAIPGTTPPLTIRDTDALSGANMGGLVSGRAKSAAIPIKPDSTVWEAIEHLCGLVGCHVKIDIDEIVVRTSEEIFAGRQSKCTFIFGGDNANCYGPKIHKKPVNNRNGVRVIALDTEQRKPVTAIYPPENELRQIQRKQPRRPRAAPKKPSSKPKAAPPAPARDVYELDPGHYTQAALDDKAKAIYLERSRQECDGTVATPVWTDEILNLANGDLVTIKVDNDLVDQLNAIGDDTAASQFLQDRMGYEKAAADALVKAARKPAQDDWYVKSVTFEHPSEKLASVEFINLVQI